MQSTFLEKSKPKKRVLIFGNGQLSMHYQNYFHTEGSEVIVASLPEVDVTNLDQVRTAVVNAEPTVVINATGITNVDWAETNQEETTAVNVTGAENIAKACLEGGVYLVHVSTGYIHNSHSALDERKEQDQPNPVNFYAYSKAKADEVLTQMVNQGLKLLIIRPNLLLSAVPHPRNVLAKMVNYNKFHDISNSMTVVEDLVKVTGELVDLQKTGVYNVTNPGLSSPFKIATLLKEIINPDMQFEKLSKLDVEKMYTVKRPDTILSTEKLNRDGIQMPEINQRLRGIITLLRDNLRNESSQEAIKIAAVENQQRMEVKQDQVLSSLLRK